MQVESLFSARFRLAGFALIGCAALASVSIAGCNHSVSADVVATVNGKDIMRADLDRQYQIVKMSQGDAPQDPSPEQANIARLTILRNMIDEEILQQRAAKMNVVASDEDVNARLTEMKLPYTQEEFDKKLKQSNQTLDDLRREIRRELTDRKLTNKEIDAKINITDAEINNFYTAHKADFNFIEPRYNIARIVVFISPGQQANNLQNNKANSEADAKNKIQALHKKLESGEDFGSVAMNFSEDKDSASGGGDMGIVTDSQLHSGATPEVYDAITRLKPGQFTDVLPMNGGNVQQRKPLGYAIYKLVSKEAAGQRTLSDGNTQLLIRQSLRDAHAQLLKSAYIEMLRDDAKVHNYLADQILNERAK